MNRNHESHFMISLTAKNNNINDKIAEFNSVCSSIKKAFYRKTKNETRNNFYIAWQSVPTVLDGSQNWATVQTI